MQAPPPLPEKALRSVLRLARFDGWSVVAVAGSLTLLSGAFRDYVGVLIGTLVTGCGVAELRGAGLLARGEARGIKWLIGSQLFLLTTILTYCALRLARPDIATIRALITPEMKEQLETLGLGIDQFLLQVYRLTYLAVALTVTLYQGGLAFYYSRKRATVAAALGA